MRKYNVQMKDTLIHSVKTVEYHILIGDKEGTIKSLEAILVIIKEWLQALKEN